MIAVMNDKLRIILVRLLASYALFFLILFFFQYATPSRLLAPPLSSVGLDITYWMLKYSGLLRLIVYNRAGSILFDIFLFATGILTLIFPLQRKWVIAFSSLLFLYSLVFNLLLIHHVSFMAGVLIVFLPFWLNDPERSWLLWQGVRYYTCLIYTMAFVWKILIGRSFYFWPQGNATFRYNLVEYMYHNPESFFSSFYRWCLLHAWVLNGGEKMVALAEGLMVIGFFTRKWDKFLFWCPVFIHLTTYFFSDVFFFQLLILDFSLLGVRQIHSLGRPFSIIRGYIATRG